MLTLFACLVVVFGILMLGETLWRAKILSYEYHRKFVHVAVGSFAASWPWLISWQWIQLIGLAMAAVVMLDRQIRVFHFSFRINRQTYGDIFFALAISLAAVLTNVKLIYMIAILHMSLADGIAALAGRRYGQHWKYKVFGQIKSVIGSMAFWLTSVVILGIGLLLLGLSPHHYWLVLLLLPPVLTWLENIGVYGLDNLLVTTAVVLALRLYA